jgi:hypothetical protein
MASFKEDTQWLVVLGFVFCFARSAARWHTGRHTHTL